MPSVKRDRLLSNMEQERLENRDSLDKRIRAINDIRVRKKLSNWLKNTADVLCIIEHLPDDQLKQVFEDEHAYRLIQLAEIIMSIKNFYPVEGELEHPEGWKTIISRSRPGQEPKESKERPATDEDIHRAWVLKVFYDRLDKHYNIKHMSKNPIENAEFYFMLLEHPALKEKVGPAELKGLNRILDAIEAMDKKEEPK
jgi:hypothetical protein